MPPDTGSEEEEKWIENGTTGRWSGDEWEHVEPLLAKKSST
jgi:hypothetical protein